MDKFKIVSSNFLELASEQRLKILSALNSKPYRVSILAKKLDVTSQEIYRNLVRLSNSRFVIKRSDEHYHITIIGKLMLSQMPIMFFVTKNQKYFSTHDIGILPAKFSRRLGVLEDCEHIKGVTNVLDKWQKIYQNSTEFIYDIINEFPSGMDEILINRINKGVKYRHIITSDLEEAENRMPDLKKLGYYDLINDDKIERKEITLTKTILILNEKEVGIIFPTLDGQPDLRHMFYGNNTMFLEWAVDYFEYYWKKAKNISRVSYPR
jgi:predicted transcriptional regulator